MSSGQPSSSPDDPDDPNPLDDDVLPPGLFGAVDVAVAVGLGPVLLIGSCSILPPHAITMPVIDAMETSANVFGVFTAFRKAS